MFLCAAPVTQEAYVWQRAWTQSVRDAVAAAPMPLTALAAEMAWQGGETQVVRVAVDYALLAEKKQPVAVAVRVGPFRGPFTKETAPVGLAQSALAAARAGGVEPSELQIDFDCATSKLDGYRIWVEAIRAAVKPTRVTITALPSWLGSSDFVGLAGACDGYVLQVHSLEKPGHVDDAMTLCDTGKARTWIRQADHIGRPFRVALPTYGYHVAFGNDGGFLALAAEGPAPLWPATVTVKPLRSDPVDIAALVSDLLGRPPMHMTGLIWYRLPVAGDTLNWAYPTLARVMRGETPEAAVECLVVESSPHLFDVEIINLGDADADVPQRIGLTWDRGQMVAADGFSGFVWRSTPRNGGAFSTEATAVLRPGERRRLGWLRLNEEGAGVHVQPAVR